MVLLDDVSFSKQSWQQRNRIRTQRGLEYLSVPVKTAGKLGQSISNCELVDQSFVAIMLKSLRTNYAKAPFFSSAMDGLAVAMVDGARSKRLVELNVALIGWMAQRLAVAKPMLLASALGVGGDRGEHVAAICECVHADRYLSPAGAQDYLIEDITSFERRHIEVCLHVYEHPEYVQRFKPFLPYASALDLIFNVGPDAGEVMRSGRRAPRAIVKD